MTPRACCLWVLAALTLLSGCSSVNYYSQLASGQLHLLKAREPIDRVINDPQRPATLRQQLAHAQAARTFASQHLLLPDNASYRLYADLKRPYVVWNVFATPEFSLDPITHCFPIAGCVAYRGYYSLAGARGEAALQREQHRDVFVSGVEAYSTLGWFDDPILNTMLNWGDERLASVIFHELAHQRVYVKDDTEFNESFANFVEQEGTRQWRAHQGLPPPDPRATQQREQLSAWFCKRAKRCKPSTRKSYRPTLCASAKPKRLSACAINTAYCAINTGPPIRVLTLGSTAR